MGLMSGKKVLIFGVANDKSIAYGIAKRMTEEGAIVGLSYVGENLAKRVLPIAEELNVKFCYECDLSIDSNIEELAAKVKDEFGTVDAIVHSVAFAPRDALTGRYIDTSREAFLTSLNISVYTLVSIAQKFESMLAENASFLTLTYYGAEKVVPNYNVMGVAKAALEATVRYLATDLGKKGVRINAISAGAIKTLSAAGIAGFRAILPVLAEKSPLGRNIDIMDCGNLAAFLASDYAINITGEIIHVDAGCNTVGV